MKLDISEKLIDLDGKPMSNPEEKEEEKESDLLLKDVICIGLKQLERDGLTAKESCRRYDIMINVYKAEGEIDVSSEDITLMKDLICKAWASPIVSGQAVKMLEAIGKGD